MGDENLYEFTNEQTSVKFLRLTTGEDIIAELTEVSDEKNHYFVLHNPLKAIYSSPSGNADRIVVYLIQWVFPRISNSTDFLINPKDILTFGDVTNDVEIYYYKQLDRFSDVKIESNKSRNLEEKPSTKGKPTFEDFMYDDYDDEEIDESEFSEDELEVVRRMINDMRKNKRRYH